MLIWADGFGTYGNTQHMRDSGLYVYTTNYDASPLQIGAGANARTGGYYWYCGQMTYSNWYGGRMFGGDKSVIGVGAAYLFPGLPGNDGFMVCAFCGDTKDSFQAAIVIRPDGTLMAVSGKEGAEYGHSVPGVVTPGAYSYLECKIFCDNVNGYIEVRRNNVTVLLVTGINTAPLGHHRVNGFMVGRNGWNSGGSPLEGVADLVVWNDDGAFNNDFIGDVRCRTFLPNTDGPLQDWTPVGAGTGFSEIDNVPFDPAHYISATTVGERSNFGKAALPINTAYLAGVQVFSAVNKTDAGTCEVTPQISSNGTVANLAPISPGTGAAIYTGIQETDPDTGLLFNRAGFDAALLQVERTA